jgi:uncharacterized protein YegP (UPF0339 family)
MGNARFRSAPAAGGDDGFQIDISDDGLAFTLTFAELQAVVDAGVSPDLVSSRVFSAVLPVDGGEHGVDLAFRVSGVAIATEGAGGYAVLSVNGTATVEAFPAGTDRSFIQELRVEAGPTSACHVAVVLVVQRDPAFPDAAATIRPSAIDAEILPRANGMFVLQRDPAGTFRFNLVAADGEVLASSLEHDSKASAVEGIESVRRTAPDAALDDRVEDGAG